MQRKKEIIHNSITEVDIANITLFFCFIFLYLYFLSTYFYVVLRMEPRASHVPRKRFVPELQLQPLLYF